MLMAMIYLTNSMPQLLSLICLKFKCRRMLAGNLSCATLVCTGPRTKRTPSTYSSLEIPTEWCLRLQRMTLQRDRTASSSSRLTLRSRGQTSVLFQSCTWSIWRVQNASTSRALMVTTRPLMKLKTSTVVCSSFKCASCSSMKRPKVSRNTTSALETV